MKLKFRAWDKESKQMFDVYSIEFRKDGIWVNLDWTSKVTGLRENWLSPDRLELMQYIGLIDKNGKEICCGDIIHEMRLKTAPMAQNGIDRVFVIEDIRDMEFAPVYCEIIGNIYQDSHLLKEAK